MKITWLGHSCFYIETAGGSVVFDPYADNYVPGYSIVRATADGVFCSHEHRDHGCPEGVTLSGRPLAAKVDAVDTFHDDKEGSLRGLNKMHILSAEGMRVAHLGDLGHIPEGAALEALQGVDALLVPVGGYYTIDAKTAKALADTCGARVVIPMHYRLGSLGYDVIAELSDFTELCQNTVYYPGNTLELTAETPAQTAVLTYECI